MVNPVLKKLRWAKSDKELAELIAKHIGSGTNQWHCKEAFTELKKWAPCNQAKHDILEFERGVLVLDDQKEGEWLGDYWCTLVRMAMSRLRASKW